MKEILIIEDEAIIAQNIKDILENLNYKVVKIISNGDDAIDFLSFHNPDLVLCDINIKGSKDGIEVATVIQRKKQIPFVFLTSYSDKHTLDRAKRALPYSYVTKPFKEKDIASALEISIFKFEQEIQNLTLSKDTLDKIAGSLITEKEFSIITSMVNGLDYEEIATGQDISKNTLKYHVKNIFRKFDVTNRAGLMQHILCYYIHKT